MKPKYISQLDVENETSAPQNSPTQLTGIFSKLVCNLLDMLNGNHTSKKLNVENMLLVCPVSDGDNGYDCHNAFCFIFMTCCF